MDTTQAATALTAEPPVRVQLPAEDVTFEQIKSAIYSQARYLYEHGKPGTNLYLSKDFFEILNRRLVFISAAHRELPHFITPHGNLLVTMLAPELDEPMSFIIA